MSQECPNCRQLTNASYSRLVKDSCGHVKCRMCLLYEEHGCKACQAEHSVPSTQDYKDLCSTNQDVTDDVNKATSEENILPLELVINKDSKLKENCCDSISVECRLSSNLSCENNDPNDNKGIAKFITNDVIRNGNPSKLHIPRMEADEMTLNIRARLSSENDRINSESSQNWHGSLTEDKFGEETTEKNKSTKRRDRSHITVVLGDPERYKCNACGKIFRNKKGKCYHDACVTGIRPYQCTFCDRSFVKRSHFEYHERVHSGYRPYKCSLCEKAFPQQNKLNRHMLSHSKEKRFTCSICSKRYSKRDDLKNHLNEHNATTTYTCKFCDKPFRILTNLKRHLRTHMSERPHTCDHCSKSFKDKSMLIRHKRIHGKERPFSCAHCNRVFLSKSELRRHLVVHSDEKPFSCEYCQTQFRRKDNLNRHIRHHHSEDSGSSGIETKNKTPLVIVAQPIRSCMAKDNQQSRQKQQKSKRAQSKSPGKIVLASLSTDCQYDQINSRLDSLGNITPVIRTTGEVSNAVPVINGPINIKRSKERNDKKMFPYTEPIPIAEAAVLNCRIEEKLYPQSASSHNYFVHNYLKDRNAKINSYSGGKLTPQDNSDFITTVFSQTSASKEKSDQITYETKGEDGRIQKINANFSESRKDLNIVSPKHERSNCVSTIKKHTFQQSHGDSSENTMRNSKLASTVNCAILLKDFQNNCKKKQSDVHWRRRTAETLKPCNR